MRTLSEAAVKTDALPGKLGRKFVFVIAMPFCINSASARFDPFAAEYYFCAGKQSEDDGVFQLPPALHAKSIWANLLTREQRNSNESIADFLATTGGLIIIKDPDTVFLDCEEHLDCQKRNILESFSDASYVASLFLSCRLHYKRNKIKGTDRWVNRAFYDSNENNESLGIIYIIYA